MSAGRVGVAGRERPVVTGRHRLEHVERLAGTTLPDDDAVGAHVHRVPEQRPDGDLALALEVGRPRLEGDQVGLAELELGGVLDGQDALVLGDERGQDVQAGRLAGARPARHEDVQARFDACPEEVEHLGRRRLEPDHVVDGDRPGRELPDGDDRTDQRQRLDDRVDARAVGQAGVDARAGLVDAPAERGDDPVDDPEDVLVGQEDAVDALDLAGALDVDVARAVDHDLGDGLVGQERFERSEARDLADELLDEAFALDAGDDEALGVDDRSTMPSTLVRRSAGSVASNSECDSLETSSTSASRTARSDVLARGDLGGIEADRRWRGGAGGSGGGVVVVAVAAWRPRLAVAPVRPVATTT